MILKLKEEKLRLDFLRKTKIETRKNKCKKKKKKN